MTRPIQYSTGAYKLSGMKKILIIEDERALQETLRTYLEESEHDFAVYEALNGEEGLRHVKQYDPDLIVLDLLMPHMDGIQVLQQLRGKHRHRAPVIIVSNLSHDADIAEVRELLSEMDRYYIKSNVQLAHLLQEIQQLVGV